jgi:hypothetical protein
MAAVKMTSAALILMLVAEPAAAFLFPWEHRPVRVVRHRGVPRSVLAPTDCKKTRDVVSKMTQEALDDALREAEPARRDAVNVCLGRHQ